MTEPAIAWFRRNLRLTDNPAWLAACQSGQPVIAVYISDELDTGGASRWWLHGSLASLRDSLAEHDVKLVIRKGDPVEILQDIVAESGARALFCSRRFEPEARRHEKRLRDALGDDVERHVYDDYLLRHPKIIKTGAGSALILTPELAREIIAATQEGAAPLPVSVKTRIGYNSIALEEWLGHLLEAQRVSDESLLVEFMLSSHPGLPLTGRVIEVDQTAVTREGFGNTVRIRVAVDKEQIPELRNDASVNARIQCGQKSLGYVWFHDLIDSVWGQLVYWF